jgi:hypothetical protein
MARRRTENQREEHLMSSKKFRNFRPFAVIGSLALLGTACSSEKQPINGSGQGGSSVLANASSLAQDPDAKLWGDLKFKLNCKQQEVSANLSAAQLAENGKLEFAGFKNLAAGDTCTMQVLSAAMKPRVDRNEVKLQGSSQTGDEVVIFASTPSALTSDSSAPTAFGLNVALRRLYSLNSATSLTAKLVYATTEKTRIHGGATLDASLTCNAKVHKITATTLPSQTGDSPINLTFPQFTLGTPPANCQMSLIEKFGDKQLTWTSTKVNVTKIDQPITFSIALDSASNGTVNVSIDTIEDGSSNTDRPVTPPATSTNNPTISNNNTSGSTAKVTWGTPATAVPAALVGTWKSSSANGSYVFKAGSANEPGTVTFPQDVATLFVETGTVSIGSTSYRYFARSYAATPNTLIYCMYYLPTASTLQFACGNAASSADKEQGIRSAAASYGDENNKVIRLTKAQ